MDSLISKRDMVIKNGKVVISKLESEIGKLENEIMDLKNLGIKKSAEIIKNATKKSEKIFEEQLEIVKDENEQLIMGIRKRFKDEGKSIESAFKIQIDITSQMLFEKLFSNRRGI